VATQNYISSPADPGPEGNIRTTPSLSPNSHAISCNLPPRVRRRWNCAERHCSCCCHRTAKTAGRFWAFNYTPLDVFRQTCNNKSCNAINYGGAFSFALSPLGIWWSATIQFQVLAAQGKFSLRQPLELERIVPYTYPGFETLWRCENKLITFEEARDRLVKLKNSDREFKNHVNPSGRSYIEVRISVL
jgi:hypothetical protein